MLGGAAGVGGKGGGGGGFEGGFFSIYIYIHLFHHKRLKVFYIWVCGGKRYDEEESVGFHDFFFRIF